jgi:hypothetical protein
MIVVPGFELVQVTVIGELELLDPGEQDGAIAWLPLMMYVPCTRELG